MRRRRLGFILERNELMGEFSGFHLKLKGYQIFKGSITQLFFSEHVMVRQITDHELFQNN